MQIWMRSAAPSNRVGRVPRLDSSRIFETWESIGTSGTGQGIKIAPLISGHEFSPCS